MHMSEQSGQRQTVIDEGTGFKGDFNSDCPIVVKGRIEGHMSAPSLTVEATGSVSGTVKVKELRSEGIIAGEYDAEYVKLSGQVQDNTVIRARTLEVALTPQRGRMQVTFGQCELEVGDVPAKSEAISRAENAGFEPSTNPAVEKVPAETSAAPSEETALEGEGDEPRRKGRDQRRNHNSSPPTR